MTEHSDLIPMAGEGEGSPGFDLVRRGYDPHQVNSHVAWLMEQLREAEAHRAAAEAAASEAAAEAARIRDDLASGRPAWDDFGGRITQILMLAEEEAATVRSERTRDAEAQLDEARRIVSDAEHTRDRTLREADEQAAGIVSTARGEAEHIIETSRSKAHKLEGESQQRLTELERQRDQVTSQLGALRDQVTSQLSALRNQLAAATAAIELPGVDEAKAVGSTSKAGSRI
ncbi:sugar-binding protein [Pseudofrankia asymbiotica]|uniref:Sugar-binding protein n=1 Tax=Pseudofrankia asymbiotica TaxID=1834516 RepID=A0A1V2IA22_9ACTN|nr:sugar-binding protein [Pseudofrankia asymbiotica]ONH28108.1 sugar-binding protein [Pseudofrankia asymbiotica]